MPGNELIVRVRCRHCLEDMSVDTTILNQYPGWYLIKTEGSGVSVKQIKDCDPDDFTRAFRVVCPDCDPEDGLEACSWCDLWIDEALEPGAWIEDSELICYNCYEDNAFHCQDCDINYHLDYGCNVDDDYTVCESCIQEYFYCECCSLYTSTDNSRHIDDFIDDLDEDERDDLNTQYEALCRYCAEDNGWPVESYPADGGRIYSSRRYGINPWSHKPSLVVRDINYLQSMYDFAYSRGKAVRVYGWELEIESNSSSENIGTRAADINEMKGGRLFYCKSDSSIRNGFEIVSHPATFEYWAGPGREILEELFDNLKGLGYTSWASGRCGFHIHTNRGPISRLHTFNLARYVHDRNCTAKLKKLSGRTDYQLDGYARLTLQDTFNRSSGRYTSPSSVEYAKQVRHGVQLGDRARALNLSNSQTVELRLFRGSLSIDKFMSSLQFYRTMLEFTNPTSGYLPATAKSKWLDYRNFVEDYKQPKAVRELKARLREVGV